MTHDRKPLGVAGVTYHTAPLAAREQAALPPEGVRAALDRLRPMVHEAVLLSTCGRTELYAVPREPNDIASCFQAAFPDSFRAYRPYVTSDFGEDAVLRLFRVSSGIDSLVFGESEILGQVRRAWDMAREAGAAGSLTSRLFQMALAVGKRVRSETEIGRFPGSVSSAAVTLAQKSLGRDLRDCTVLVIGTGEVGRGVAKSLLERGATRLMVANHNEDRAHALAGQHGGVAVPWPIPAAALAQADIVLSSTGAPGLVLSRDDLSAALALRNGDRLHLIDLAVPRDIDPGAADLPGVRLHNLDDIETAVASYIEQRRQTQPKVEAIVAEQQGQFGRWLRQRAVASTIQGLRERSEEVRLAEMRRALPKLPGLSERELAVVDQMTTRLVNKLLHPPTANLQAAAADGRGAEYGEIAADLFDLNGASPSAGRNAPT